MRRPRLRFSIRSMMVAVVLASVVLLVIVVIQERRRWMVELQMAEASYRQAELTREVAEIAVAEYVQAISKQDLAAGEAEIAFAEAQVKASKEDADTDAVNGAEASLRHARYRMSILKSIKDQTAKSLTADLQKAMADELARKADLQRVFAGRSAFVW